MAEAWKDVQDTVTRKQEEQALSRKLEQQKELQQKQQAQQQAEAAKAQAVPKPKPKHLLDEQALKHVQNVRVCLLSLATNNTFLAHLASENVQRWLFNHFKQVSLTEMEHATLMGYESVQYVQRCLEPLFGECLKAKLQTMPLTVSESKIILLKIEDFDKLCIQAHVKAGAKIAEEGKEKKSASYALEMVRSTFRTIHSNPDLVASLAQPDIQNILVHIFKTGNLGDAPDVPAHGTFQLLFSQMHLLAHWCKKANTKLPLKVIEGRLVLMSEDEFEEYISRPKEAEYAAHQDLQEQANIQYAQQVLATLRALHHDEEFNLKLIEPNVQAFLLHSLGEKMTNNELATDQSVAIVCHGLQPIVQYCKMHLNNRLPLKCINGMGGIRQVILMPYEEFAAVVTQAHRERMMAMEPRQESPLNKLSALSAIKAEATRSQSSKSTHHSEPHPVRRIRARLIKIASSEEFCNQLNHQAVQMYLLHTMGEQSLAEADIGNLNQTIQSDELIKSACNKLRQLLKLCKEAKVSMPIEFQGNTGKPRVPAEPKTAALMSLDKWNQLLRSRVTVWNRTVGRKISGNASPMQLNLKDYLNKYPDCEEYTGQDKVQVAAAPPKPAVPAIDAVVYVCYDGNDWYKAKISALEGNKATVRFDQDGIEESVTFPDPEVLLEPDYLALMAKKEGAAAEGESATAVESAPAAAEAPVEANPAAAAVQSEQQLVAAEPAADTRSPETIAAMALSGGFSRVAHEVSANTQLCSA